MTIPATSAALAPRPVFPLPVKPRRGAGAAPDLFGFLAGLAAELEAEGKAHRVRAVGRLGRNLRMMAGDATLPFGEIDSGFAERYLGWLRERGMAESTCAAEMGTLRTALKSAVEAGLLERVPEAPKGVRYVQRAKEHGEFPGAEVFERLASLPLADRNLAVARDMFLFAYYCGGMEWADVAALTPGDFTGNLLRYTRRAKGREWLVRFDGKAAGILARYISAGAGTLFPRGSGKRETAPDTARRMTDKRLKKLGGAVGCPGLNFGMNIPASLAQIPRTQCGGVVSVWDRFALIHNS